MISKKNGFVLTRLFSKNIFIYKVFFPAGVTSEGEKSLNATPVLQVSDADVELDELEGREAEASPTAAR